MRAPCSFGRAGASPSAATHCRNAATAAPLPHKSAAYTDIQSTGAGVWQ